MLIAQSESGSLWMLLVAAAGTTFALLRIHALRRRRHSAERATGGSCGVADASGETEQAAAERRERQRLEIELHDLARDVQARIDNKLALLQLLLRTADEKIARLETLTERPSERTAGARIAEPHFRITGDPAYAAANGDATARYAAVYAMADAGHNCAAIANRLGEPIGEIEMILSLRSRR